MFRKLICMLIAALVAALGVALFTSVFSDGNAAVAKLPQQVTLYRKGAAEIVTLSYDELVIGCIFAQCDPAYDDEALRAAACVINSRCLYQLQSGERVNGADICDESCPWMSPEEVDAEYGKSSGSYRRKVRGAAEYGMERALLYEGELIQPQMCAYSTGRTEDGGVPYHTSKLLAADENCDDGFSTAAFSADMVRCTLTSLTGVSALSARPEEWFSGAVYTDGGTLSEVRFGAARLTGEQLRDVFSLRSAAIKAEYVEGRFLFTVLGWGDNTGMSLHAAAEMAKSGSSAEEILEFFYAPAQLIVIS